MVTGQIPPEELEGSDRKLGVTLWLPPGKSSKKLPINGRYLTILGQIPRGSSEGI